MTDEDKKSMAESERARAHLRRKAEDVLRRETVFSHVQLEQMTPEEIQRKLHDLQVHQIELEMQNVELRRAQAELDTSRTRYFELYELAPVGYCTVSESGLILEANLYVAALLEVARGALLKKPISNYIAREDQDTYYLHRKQLLATHEPQVCELRMVKSIGTPCWVRLNANLAEDGKGTPVCRVVLSDITERKRVEEEKTRLEAQFQQAQKMESIGRLAGGVAHDFNNKLAIILGYTEIAMDKIGQTDSCYADLKEIHKAAKHSAVLTRQLLTFARKQMVTPRVLDLNVTVTEILKMLERLIGEDIEISWLSGTGLWQVKLDPTQLDQILANLCVNARDAIVGVGRITIKTENITLDEASCDSLVGSIPGEYVLITVSDNGCGMDEETRVKIFEPFFTTKDVDKGTGLGLATVYGAVKQNDGFIYAESEPGSGTTIKIYLPRYREEAIERQQENIVEQTRPGTETILLVEDEPVLLKMGKRMLEGLGYNVLAANSPGRAQSLAREFGKEIDLIITDVIMPEMNGIELVDRISSFLPRLRSLFVSGYSFDILSKQGKIDPNTHFIQKPFSKQELSEQVRLALEN